MSQDLFLEVPLPYKPISIQASSIPCPPLQNPQPFWTDPALRVMVVRISEEAALLIPYKTFRERLSLAAAAGQRNHTPDRMSPGYSMAWEQWTPRGVLLVRIPQADSISLRWGFQHCHAYGSRVAVQGYQQPVTILDLNPWAERNARRFPQPVRPPWWHPGTEDLKQLCGTGDAALPHAALTVCDACYGFA